jgi:hypothetical protein
MYIAHTVPGRYPFYPKSLVLYLEEEEGPSMAWACVRHSVLYMKEKETMNLRFNWIKHDSHVQIYVALNQPA